MVTFRVSLLDHPKLEVTFTNAALLYRRDSWRLLVGRFEDRASRHGLAFGLLDLPTAWTTTFLLDAGIYPSSSSRSFEAQADDPLLLLRAKKEGRIERHHPVSGSRKRG